MNAVYKYKLESKDNLLEMSINSQILHIAYQNEQLYLWALVDTEEPKRVRKFYIVGTGWQISEEIADRLIHIKTVFQDGGQFVWHIFEVVEV